MGPRDRRLIRDTYQRKKGLSLPAFGGRALQPARACIGPACHSHPVNHEAICSDPAELLARRHSRASCECRHQQSGGQQRSGGYRAHRSCSRRCRAARFCRRRLTSGPAARATAVPGGCGLHGHRGRPRGLQPWPGGGCRRAWRACGGRRASELFKRSCAHDSCNAPSL